MPNNQPPSEGPHSGAKAPSRTPEKNTPAVIGRSPAQRRWKMVGTAFGSSVCLLALAAGTVVGHFYWNSTTAQAIGVRGGLTAITDGLVHGDFTHQWTPEVQFPERTSMNVLILGVDHDYDNYDRIVKSSPGRSDSILLAHVDFIQNSVKAITIPRDAAVHIPGYRGIHKINAAHNLGGEELTMETVKEVFGVQPDACVTVNFEGFQQIVNAIGGIDVDVKVPRGHKGLDYDDNWGNLHIHLKPGLQHLDGYRAMGYVRMRHSDSDEMRSERQHEFLEAMRNKIKSPSTFMVLPKLVDKLNDNLKLANLSRDQMYALANFARRIPRENITIKTLPSFEGPSYVTIYADKSAQMIQELFFSNQQVALNVDAPDPNAVRSMNAPYERGAGRHRSRDSRRAHSAATPLDATAPAIPIQDEQPVEDRSLGTGGTLLRGADPGKSDDQPKPDNKPDKADRNDKSNGAAGQDKPDKTNRDDGTSAGARG